MPAAPTPLALTDDDFAILDDSILNGSITFFLGAGVNYAQCANGSRSYQGADSGFLPTGVELGVYIGGRCGHPDTLDYLESLKFKDPAHAAAQGLPQPTLDLLKKWPPPDLARICQHAQSTDFRLQFHLHEIFSHTGCKPTLLHEKLALLARRAAGPCKPVFITTNYDVMMERALGAAGVPFDILYYNEPPPGDPTWLHHWRDAHLHFAPLADGAARPAPFAKHATPVTDVTRYMDLPVDPAPGQGEGRVILVKIHGTVSPLRYQLSSFVISSADYIRFLRRVPADNLLPVALQDRLTQNQFLFLGYGLGDWNIMAICQNLWVKRPSQHYESWAFQYRPSEPERQRWQAESAGKIKLFDQDLTAFAQAVQQRWNLA